MISSPPTGKVRWLLQVAGHYISVDTSQGTHGDTAALLSPELYSEEWSCIRLIYQIAAISEPPINPTALNLYLRIEGESFDQLLWTSTEYSESWLIASLDIRNSTNKYRIVLEGVLGRDIFASIAIFEIKVTTGYCLECNFEENHLCGYLNRWNPNVNWFVGGGNTGNSQSILPRDHTLKNEYGHYMYVDSLYVKHFQEVAQLVSPRTTTPMSGCLSFYYQVQQGNGIAFTIYMRDANGFYEELWKAGSLTSNDWVLGEAEFSAPYPMEVIFEVAFNSAKGGYIALDDIFFSPVFCSNQTGYYLLANTKFTSQPGYIGRLYSITLPGNLQYCLRFYYALYGFFKMRDTLAVYIFEENHVVQEKIWSVLDTPRGVWTQTEITFKKPMPCKKTKENNELVKPAKLKQEQIVDQTTTKVKTAFNHLSPEVGNVEDEWKEYKISLFNIAEELCGKKKSGKGWNGTKNTAWWCEEVKEAVKLKKEFYKCWIKSRKDDYLNYRL
ncbi:MAM domain-containing protein 2 [Varanus komodoensis]|nr:MAM domain-containing protein 2 [Varanus komodoensis]